MSSLAGGNDHDDSNAATTDPATLFEGRRRAHFADVAEDDHEAVVEGLIGLLWDCARPAAKPLWWCLDKDVKRAFRTRVMEALNV